MDRERSGGRGSVNYLVLMVGAAVAVMKRGRRLTSTT